MQIVVNTRLLIKNRLDGMGWFSYQTLKHITQKNPKVHFIFLFDRDFDEEFIFSDNITPIVLSPQARHPVLYYAWLQFSVKQILQKLQPDLFLSPDGFLVLGTRSKQLPVIHDINFLHHPRDSKWLTSKYYNYYFPRFARQATRIATVSEFSKQDIAVNYQVDPGDIDVVYNGINPFFKPLSENEKQQTREKYTGGTNYFVSVGSLHPRKNVTNLVKAFGLFKKERASDMKLVLAGPPFWGMQEIRNAIESNNLNNDVVFTGRLADDELARVLGSAMAMTFVPYYEGFGIPLVEAMACEVPVLTSQTTCLPEIAGDAAVFVNPFDIQEIKKGMLDLFGNENLRGELVKKGNTRKQLYSWERSAELLWESIGRAIDEK